MKKFLCLMMALVMVFCLTACSGSGATAKVIEINLTEEEYAFGVDKNNPELLKQVNDFIAEIKKDGTLDEICEKYFGGGTPTPITSAKEDSSKEQLIVATNAAFEPFEYTEGDKYLGVDMELAALLAEKLGMELVIKNMDFDAVCLSVGQHKCDIAMAGLTIKPDREEYVTFSDSYYAASQKLIALSDDATFDKCKTVEDVEKILNSFDSKTTIGVQTGTTGQLYCEGDADWGFAGFKVTTKGYKNGSMAVQDMLNGNINYVVIDSAPAAFITASLNEMA
ncbi:MAG: transporter substrate-binding domain-containing protein [Clostridia bacterium]|nr:transporter substrate-binding domain-containing protein [Clostridia bacterium]